MPQEKPESSLSIALEKSIKHWRRIVAEPLKTSYGQRHCALCSSYYDFECSGCCVAAHTNEPYCRNTPYAVFDGYRRLVPYTDISSRNCSDKDFSKLRELAQDELDFLISLRTTV